MNFLPTVFDDGEQGLTLLMQDISGERQLEEMRTLLASIVESSDDVIIGKAVDGTILSWNHAAMQRYGYSPEEITGKNISSILPPGYEHEPAMILDKISREERVNHFKTQRLTRDGRIIDVSITISPIFEGDGTIIGASTIGRDIWESS